MMFIFINTLFYNYIGKFERDYFMYKKIVSIFCISLIFLTGIVGCKGEKQNSDAEISQYGELLPDEEIITEKLIGQEFTVDSEESVNGTIKYQFKNIVAYDNIYDMVGMELKENIDRPAFYGIDKNAVTDQHIIYPNYFDNDTGKLMDGYYIFVFEIDVTNVDATSTLYDNPYLFNFSGLFRLVNRSGEKPVYARGAYFKEDAINDDVNDFVSWKCEIKQGETKTIYMGYMFDVLDTSETPFSRMGLTSIYGGNTTKGSTYSDNYVFFWFDMSDIIADMENKQVGATE